LHLVGFTIEINTDASKDSVASIFRAKESKKCRKMDLEHEGIPILRNVGAYPRANKAESRVATTGTIDKHNVHILATFVSFSLTASKCDKSLGNHNDCLPLSSRLAA
jgi:hypothetical protein